MRIRKATSRDVPAIAVMIGQLAEYEHLVDEVSMTPEDLRLHIFGVAPVAEVIIAEDETEEAVGFALFFPSFSTFRGRPGIYLEDLFVRPTHRGCGAGTAMLRHIARLAVGRGCARVEWSVLNWNEPAIKLYEKLGARANFEWTTCRLSDSALGRLAAEGAT
jgi:GNAT superfamily N-acetyltransferase